jgi:6-phosphofructokinase 1
MDNSFIDFTIQDLGERAISSPVNVSYYTPDSKRILHNIYLDHYKDVTTADGAPLSLEVAGPRDKIFFDPAQTKAAIVTCGGLCPGINDVIRAIFM